MSVSRARPGRRPRPPRASGSKAPRAGGPRIHPPRARRLSSRPASWAVHRERRPNSLRTRDESAHRNRYEASRLRRGGRGRDMTSKDNFEFAHAYRKEVAWMSQNTNTLPVHPAILDAIRASADEQEFNLYPRKAGVFGLSEAIKEDLRLDDVEMILTNGGIEGEYIATRALLKAGDEVLSTDPAFLPIHDQVAMAGAPAIRAGSVRAPHRPTPEPAPRVVPPPTYALLLLDPHNPPPLGFP